MKIRQIAFRFLPTFLAFPIGGQLVVWFIGPIETYIHALLAGLIVGLIVGFAQFLALRPLEVSKFWILASALSLAVASPSAWLAINFQTSIVSLTLWGLIAGALFGFGQTLSQKLNLTAKVLWTATTAATWGLAWLISSNVIVDAEAHYAVFGSTGALLATVLQAVVINSVFRKG